ncbi:MAG: FAD-binding protein [Acidimicrobiales bacterium]
MSAEVGANGVIDAGSRLTFGPAVLEFAEEIGADGPVAIEGGRTRWSVGGLPDAPPRLLRAPSGVVQYKPDEMIVRVGAGTAMAELNNALAEHRQRTALPDRGGTVGGAVVVGENDRDVLARGALRASVLQVTYVAADGKVVSGGGPTVKNVSGFDIPRLLVGSLGTLGCVAEVILRTNPIPPVGRWFTTEVDPFDLYDRLLAPSAVLWDGRTTWLHLEGHGPDVDAEAGRAAQLGSLVEAEGPPSMDHEHRWSLPPAELRSIADVIPGSFFASIGVGTVHADFPQPPRPLSDAVQGVHERMKLLFDPTGRLNPGRIPGRY